jgi:hypothetical protein
MIQADFSRLGEGEFAISEAGSGTASGFHNSSSFSQYLGRVDKVID